MERSSIALAFFNPSVKVALETYTHITSTGEMKQGNRRRSFFYSLCFNGGVADDLPRQRARELRKDVMIRSVVEKVFSCKLPKYSSTLKDHLQKSIYKTSFKCYLSNIHAHFIV